MKRINKEEWEEKRKLKTFQRKQELQLTIKNRKKGKR